MAPDAARLPGHGAAPLADRDPALRSEHLVWLLGSVGRVHRLRVDADLLLHQCPPPHRLSSLIEAAERAGLRAGLAPFSSVDGGKFPTPFVAFFRATEAEGRSSGVSPPAVPRQPDVDTIVAAPDLSPALVIKFDGERFVYLKAGLDEPHVRLASQFDNIFEPVVVLLTPARSQQPLDDSISPAQQPPFGFRWFWPELLRHRSIWRDVLLASAAIQLIGLATPLFTQVTIDKVIPHQTLSTLWAVGVGLVIFLVFNAVMTWLRQHLVLHTGNRIDAVLAADVFSHLLRLPLAYFDHRPTGTTVARLQAVETVRQFITGAAVTIALDLPFLLILLAVMFAYSWQLTLIAVSAVALLALISAVVTPVLRERLNRQFLLGARNQAFVTEYVAGMETVKSLQFEPVLGRRFGEYLAEYLGAGYSTRSLSNTYQVSAQTIEQTMLVAILIAGALAVMRGDGFTIGMLVAFQMFASRMTQPMLRIAGLWQEFQQAAIAVRRLGDIMDAPAEPETGHSSSHDSDAAAIELKGVSFRYGEAYPWLFRDFSLTIQPGRLVAITGPSGCGKSTLARLLLGFQSPREGLIRIFGADQRQLSAIELRRAFGVVPQETVLFAGTVRDNLLMANPGALPDEIVGSCRLAGIHRTIESLPAGYDTVLGEHGIGLSGGQKQRIAIARALLKKPRILIFDEATSQLDAQTAESLAATINQLKTHATIVFIAHVMPRGLQVDEAYRLGA